MVTDLTLVYGNRNFSSWSMRAWLVLQQTGAPFREHQIFLDEDPDRRERRKYAPTGRVPVLRVGDHAIWDSLAITEYLAERNPDAGLWPNDPLARARARSLCCEMHAGFDALRGKLPMNCRARKPFQDRGDDVAADVARVASIWESTRAEFGAGGDFLFGSPSAADWFFAPVASRFVTYGVAVTGAAGRYAERLLGTPTVARWLEEAALEGHSVEPYASMP